MLTERAFTAPVILPDAQIEYWAEAYLAHPSLARGGISFEEFLRATPQVRAAPRFLLLLAVRERLDALERRKNGRRD